MVKMAEKSSGQKGGAFVKALTAGAQPGLEARSVLRVTSGPSIATHAPTREPDGMCGADMLLCVFGGSRERSRERRYGAVASVAMEQPRRSRRCAAWPERAPTREAGHGCRRQRRHKSVAFEKLENLSHLNVAQAQQEGAVSAVAFASNHKKSRLHIDER